MDLSFLIQLVGALVAFIIVNWVYFKVLKIAKDKGLVDNPDARKLQQTPIPVMGGIAVFLGVVAGVLASHGVAGLLGYAHDTCLVPIICALVVMLYIGAIDDIEGLTPISRLVIEVLTMLGLIYSTGMCFDDFQGLWGVGHFSWWIAVPFTVFTGVGVINAVNMIDGVNGLSSGLCIVCSLAFGIVFLNMEDYENATLAFTTTAALVPFLMHNVFGKRSRMFIGDAGTMVMGILLMWFAMCLINHKEFSSVEGKEINLIALAIAIMSVPMVDTLRVMTMRMIKGKSPFSPDKTHLHHVFIQVGISHSITAFTEIMIAVTIMGIWLISVVLEVGIDLQLYLVLGAAFCLVCGTYAFLYYHVKNHTHLLHHLSHFSIKTHLGHTHWWLRFQEWLDSPEPQEQAVSEIAKIKMEHLARKFEHIDTNNFKEVDRKKVYDFMKGKAEVFVDDIQKRSGAEAMRVYPIIFEGEQEGLITVITRDSWGAPVIVSLE